MKLSENDPGLVDILANLLNDENLTTDLTPSSSLSTTDFIYTHGNCTSCLQNKCESDRETTCRESMYKVIFKQVRKEVVFVLTRKPQSYDLKQEEWQAMRYPAKDWSIIIKPVNEGSCVVIWD